ncbi:MAG: hypothetical protein K2P83_13970 [Nitrosomonas sp.]|nr:hypothetical protein [Nitrosomonas sp.]
MQHAGFLRSINSLSSLRFHHLAITKEVLTKLIAFMVRQAHHERNQYIAVRLEPVEGLNQNFRNSFP